MKKKKFLIINQIAMCFLITVSLVYGGEQFNAIASSKDQRDYPPKIIMKPDGGYIALWAEDIKRENEPRYYHYFYSIVNAENEVVVDKREINIWRTKTGVEINGTWLDNDRILLLGWPTAYYATPERIILSSSGEILAGPDTFKGGNSDATFLKNSKGNVYAVVCIPAIAVLPVYPEIKEIKVASRQEYVNYFNKYPAHTFGFRYPVVTITSEDKLLICCRVGWGYTPLKERGIYDEYLPDKIFYILADLAGNIVIAPVILDIAESAIRKIPGVHLGGMYFTLERSLKVEEIKAVSEDMDISTLPNGNIILSVTASDENGKLSVYQLKFTPEGQFMEPKEIQVVNAKAIPESGILPVVKCVPAQIWPGAKSRGLRNDLVLFGFDEEGNFYSDREVWNENWE